jgi:RNA polymerase sigma-70 factor (ECF subfamily)
MNLTTCWTVIQSAAAGNQADRERFARLYAPVIKAYLVARWRKSAYLKELENAIQEVFLECFKQNGVLQRCERGRPGGFRAFLYGAVRHVALRFETHRARRREWQPLNGELESIPKEEASLSQVFDRAWVQALLQEATQQQAAHARQTGEDALRRVELLRLRYQEGLPIREIARRWNTDREKLHRECTRAKQEFRRALLEVVAFHHPGSPEEVERVCAELLDAVA